MITSTRGHRPFQGHGIAACWSWVGSWFSIAISFHAKLLTIIVRCRSRWFSMALIYGYTKKKQSEPFGTIFWRWTSSGDRIYWTKNVNVDIIMKILSSTNLIMRIIIMERIFFYWMLSTKMNEEQLSAVLFSLCCCCCYVVKSPHLPIDMFNSFAKYRCSITLRRVFGATSESAHEGRLLFFKGWASS